MDIGFNKPYLTGKENIYIADAVASGKISGNGKYTQLCQNFFEHRYGFKKCLLTTSCTDALEMCAILLNIKEGDEVIMPSYTFVSTANPFILRGAKIVFADSMSSNPNIDASLVESLITPNTRVIVVVHYAGIACDMETIMTVAKNYNLFVVEDAAQAIDSFYIDKNGDKLPLGGIGHLSAFSFHETKNIMSGEGGMLVVNDERFIARAEIIWEKGTNRSAFWRGEVDKYNWVDIGSSFLPSEIIAAFLWAQLENLDKIQTKRKLLWERYYAGLLSCNRIGLPVLPKYAVNNAHMFYIVCSDLESRILLTSGLKDNRISAVFHYLSLHNSPFFINLHDGRKLCNADRFSNTLLRLPMYYELTQEQVDIIVKSINSSQCG